MHSSKSHNLRGKIKFVNKKLTWAWFYIYIIVQKGLYNLPERQVVYKRVLVFFIVFSMQLNINARKERISILKKKNNYRTSKICFELYIFTTSSRTKTMKYIYGVHNPIHQDSIFRSNESLKWPIAIGSCSSLSVMR